MGYGRAYMKGDVAYRARIDHTNHKGERATLILGPYSTAGAARGQATSKTTGAYALREANVFIEKATYWQKA